MDEKVVVRRRRIRLQPQPLNTEKVSMTPSRWRVLGAISDYGGMLSKPLLARLVYPKSVEDAAFYRIRDRRRVRSWLETYGEGYVWLRLQVLNLLLTLLRINRLPEIKHSRDVAFWEWLQELQARRPEAFEEFQAAVEMLHQLEIQALNGHPELAAALVDLEADQYQGQQVDAKMRKLRQPLQQAAAAVWLEAAIEREWSPPLAFAERPRYQKEVVSHYADSELRYLTDAGLIAPHLQEVGDDQVGTCYYLTKTGRDQLGKYRGMSLREVFYKTPGAEPTKFKHRLRQSQFRLAMTLGAQKAGYTINQWLDTWKVEKTLKKVSVKLMKRKKNPETGELEEVRKSHRVKYFDDIAEISPPEGEGSLPIMIIEFDNATEVISSVTTTQTVEHKYRTMGEALRVKKMQEAFPSLDWSNGAWIVTVTAGSEERLQRLYTAAMNILGDSDASDRYWFCRLVDATPNSDDQFKYTVFTEPIWLRGGQGKANYQVMRPEARK